SDDADLLHALRSFRDGADRFHLHPVPAGSTSELMRSLTRLDFAGAVVLGETAQADAQRVADRSSLDARELGAADTLTVTPAGILADHTFGRAVAALLHGRRSDATGADVVIVGASYKAKALARQPDRTGDASVAVLDEDRVAAERALPTAAGTTLMARASSDPLAVTLIERADLLVRVDKGARVDDALLGPHLTVIDLAQGAKY